MSKLVLTHDGAVIKEFVLDKERLTIGRKPGNDIHIDDPTISGEHAAILMLQHAYVEDLNSTNGTSLNGKPVTKRQLTNGDLIKIGRHEFKFIDENVNEFERTVMISPQQSKKDVIEPPKKYQVSIVSGPKSGEVITLNKPYTTLGSPGGQVAVIAKRGSKYYLMPMSGTINAKPPLLNNTAIGVKSELLSSGDRIEVSGTQLEFQEQC
ncbi:hypothetical protein MNBD_GAMMA23-1598 [hydrothermal vent metagenome]|uniref:FHA domain-containing protein n=1 Tax=hydrothermal vent metagenome TaxID=652676 RepID=A0A3B0ZR00_9ZZZZ